MPWTSVNKPTGPTYTNVNAQGKEQYDQADIQYDDVNVFYDGTNPNQWTDINKPTAPASWVSIAKPT